MKKYLSKSEIAALATGVAKTEEKDGLLYFYRFTDAQMEAYRAYSEDFYKKCFTTAGVRLSFSTDSEYLNLCGRCFCIGTSRKYYGFDVYVNGALIKSQLGDFDEGTEYFDFSIEAQLDKGTKNVTIYFPWTIQATVSDLMLDEGAIAAPIKRPYKMISFGDSITHGYDSRNPSFSYASRISDALMADAINKGIGGEKFFPTLAKLKDGIEPDVITVAYGTNDWKYSTKDGFEKNSRAFYERLSKNYPNAKIFALAPIWRENCDIPLYSVGEFENVRRQFESIANDLSNVTVIDCFDFVAPVPASFAPDLLHPNDEGFRQYANNLYAEIKKYL